MVLILSNNSLGCNTLQDRTRQCIAFKTEGNTFAVLRSLSSLCTRIQAQRPRSTNALKLENPRTAGERRDNCGGTFSFIVQRRERRSVSLNSREHCGEENDCLLVPADI